MQARRNPAFEKHSGLAGVRGRTIKEIVPDIEEFWMSDDEELIARDMAERTWNAVETTRAQEALRVAVRRKDEFLAMLAHELRNPLAPISAAAQLMAMADLPRVTQGPVSITRTPQDMKTILANAVEQARPLNEAQGHQLAIDLPPEPAQVAGDGKRLVQVFTNFLNNAADTRRRAASSVSQWRPNATWCWSTSSTTASASRPNCCRIFSMFSRRASAASTAPPEAWASGWRWCAAWPSLARHLLAQPETRHVVCIAVTGYGRAQDRETALAAGFQHHLVKPVDVAQLTSLLSSLSRP